MKRVPTITLIVAYDKCGGIGKNGTIPWDIAADSKFFYDTTTQVKSAVIYGLNTWKRMNCTPLPKRINVVVSTTVESSGENVYFAKSMKEALALDALKDVDNIFLCGGPRIYEEALFMKCVDSFYITYIVDEDYECDTRFQFHNLTVNDGSKFCRLLDRTVDVFDSVKNKKVKTRFIKLVKLPSYINYEERTYLELLYRIITQGHFRSTRNANTWALFGESLQFDLKDNILPVLTTKKLFVKGIFEELMFFLRGDTNTKHLSDLGVKIWEPNTSRQFLDSNNLSHYKEGDMGPMYGYNLLHFGHEYEGSNADYTDKGFNQLEYCMNLIKTDPFSRRIIMTTYNPSCAKQGCLYPCHGISIQFSVGRDNDLSCMMTQRSADTFCGIPFNIASYALLVHLIVQTINKETGSKLIPGTLIMSLGDVHIYESHYDQVICQLLREPKPFPKISFLNAHEKLTDYKFEDIELIGYDPHPSIPVKMVP